MPEPLHWSIGYFKARGYTLSVFCPNMHGSEVDLSMAIGRFGADFLPVERRPEFLRAFRCAKCGERGHSLSIEPRTGY